MFFRNAVINNLNISHKLHKSTSAIAFCSRPPKDETLKFVQKTENGRFIDSSNLVPTTTDFHEKTAWNNQPNRMKDKLNSALRMYEEISGLDDVKEAQNKVIEYQERLKFAQETRRQLAIEQTQVRLQLQDIHTQIQRCNRGEKRYLELVQQEFNLMQHEREKLELFDIADQEERDLFTHLTSAVKISHEKERLQAENTKYWSLIASLIGALLGVTATVIGYYYRNNQFKQMNSLLTDLEQNFRKDNKYIYEFIERFYQKERELEALKNLQQSQESWGGYFKRKTVGVYRYFIPRRE